MKTFLCNRTVAKFRNNELFVGMREIISDKKVQLRVGICSAEDLKWVDWNLTKVHSFAHLTI